MGPAEPERVHERLPTLPALDGIRAVAVAAVLLYHSDIFWFPGGLLGVEVFFVLSGYLITSLLWTEVGAAGGIDMVRFWGRRARRLLPALFVMLAVVSVVWVVHLPSEVARIRGDVAAAATYTSNWYLIHGNHSYFIEFTRPSPFAHLWSLAIEEQFYLLWPPVVLLLWRWLRRPRRVAGAILAMAALSSGFLALIFHGGDPSRIYYGTDTRAAGLLIGAALAILWRPFALGARRWNVKPFVLDATTIGACGVLVWAFMRMDDLSPSTYRPGLLFVSLATAALIATCVHPDARMARILAIKPLRWLGKRSYSVYIWYFPVFVLTRPGVDFNISIGTAFALRVATTLTLAELSYRFIEQPIRHGALGRIAAQLRRLARQPGPFGRRWVLRFTTAGVVSMMLFTGLAVAMVRAPTPPAALAEPSSLVGLDRPEEIGPVSFDPGKGLPVVAIGDSVMSGARPWLRLQFGRMVIDAVVGRQVSEGIARLQYLKAHGELGDTVIIHLGNNGRFNAPQFDRIMDILAGVPTVVFVTVKVPRRWESSVNRVLEIGAQHHPTVVIVNWHSLWQTCPGHVFVSDGTHLTNAGARCYARLIAAAA